MVENVFPPESLTDFSFPRRCRLRKSSDYARVYADGSRRRGVGLSLIALDGDGSRPPRFGVSVHRRIRGACLRNRIKRICREAYRLYREAFPAQGDMVLTVRPEFACASPAEVALAVRRMGGGKR
ncbi:MAG: ribonuclease P protein component [Desulfobulbaceae bacterium]|jgi:ribonuclease P protein component|nr:ribonuclease P protein component [Desulfobulbaceae bacterium]